MEAHHDGLAGVEESCKDEGDRQERECNFENLSTHIGCPRVCQLPIDPGVEGSSLKRQAHEAG